MRLRRYVPFLIALVPFLFGGCTSMLLVKSAWNGEKITIDGKDDDWGDTMFYIESAQLTAGVRNDDRYLYLILKTTNRRQSFQIMGLGLTIWFDPSGGTGEKWGIHFPIGRGEGEMDRKPESSDREANPSFVLRSPNELELLGVNENGPERLSITDLKGIQMQMQNTGDGLVYELRVPLHSSPQDPIAINPKGPQIGIGFIGGKFQSRGNYERRGGRDGFRGGEGMPGGEGGEGGEMPGGMEGGMGEGGERGGFRQQPGEQRQEPKQIDFWLKVNLAPPPAQAPPIE